MPIGVVSNEDVGFQDKPFVVADASTTSPKRDWGTQLDGIGPEEEDSPGGVRQIFPMMFSQSDDGGVRPGPSRSRSAARPKAFARTSATSITRRTHSSRPTGRSTRRSRRTTQSTGAPRS